MKKIILVVYIIFFIDLTAQVTINPSAFEVDASITITLDLNSTATNCNGLTSPTKVYMHSGIGDDTDAFGFNVIGNWGVDDGVGEMTNNNNGTWSITITPETYYGLSTSQASNATQIGMVFRNADGSQELKANNCQDFKFSIGIIKINIVAPTSTPVFLESGENLTIKANLTYQGSLEPANFKYFLNDNLETSGNGFTTYQGTINNITSNSVVKIEGSPLSTADIAQVSFDVVIVPAVVEETLPSGLEEGINYNISDPTKATLVLNAPGKDYVQLAGSFNNYTPTEAYFMKKDTASDLFWLELTGLTPNAIYTYQYWAYDKNPIANSPALVKIADPYSTLVLSPFDDTGIPSLNYPSLPAYPTGQEREVTVLQTNKTAYSWQVSNFSKPKKEDLIIYEVLIRDFDANRSFQDLIDRIDYFKNLNINAIELMPVMEFEGNESWGYNTAFHMALDKFYGTENKFKEFIDLCHQHGIAVILDIALNHAFGRNPMVRLWMNDADGDGWGAPSTENPYFNETAKHTFNVGYDFNHSNTLTKAYTKRVIKHWIEEFKIDGFRWDLTKGFTQNCSSTDEACTNRYQQDRVDVLKEYADYSWSLDETHYVIFEHLGTDAEEQEWANYRINDATPKGIMMWGEMWSAYKSLAQGQTNNITIDRIGHTAHGFTQKRLIGFTESHDKDRIMYEMTTFGITSTPSHNVRDLNTALTRMSALGAVSIPIPGPKMLWHFADLGMDDSIWTCSNGIVNSDYDGNADGDCKLDTKPQPQWTDNWLNDANRSRVYNDWARLIQLKTQEPVFKGDYNITSGTQTPRISIYTGDENTSGAELKNVIIIANFATTPKNVNPNFPYNGLWYDLMDNSGSPSSISGSITNVNLLAGTFKIYGNQAVTLKVSDSENLDNVKIYPNPSRDILVINKAVDALKIYNIQGKLIKTFSGPFNKGEPFDISQLPAHIYFVKVEKGNLFSNAYKFVKL